MLTLAYIPLVRSKKNIFSIYEGFGIILFCVLLIPICLETDHIRYIFDGINTSQGVNPFSVVPKTMQIHPTASWTKYINHAHLTTIYPPFAQICFLVSTYLNPFFWPAFLSEKEIWDISIQHTWQLYLGWKILIGLFCGGMLCSIKKYRWDLLLLNPLFLMKGLGNTHIDVIVACLIVIALSYAIKRKHPLPVLATLSFSIWTKWFPFIYMPYMFIYCLRKFSIKKNMFAGFACIIFSMILAELFVNGSNGNFLKSTFVYGNNWYFFGYVHRLIADILSCFMPLSVGVDIARKAVAVIGFVGACALFFRYITKRSTLNRSIYLMSVLMLAMSPTLHPWYLLALLATGYRYIRVQLTPWVWPILSMTSIVNYIHGSDLMVFRYGIYAIITVCLMIDFGLFSKVTSKKMALRRN